MVAHLTSTYQPRAGETCMRVAAAVSKALDDENSSESGARGKLIFFFLLYCTKHDLMFAAVSVAVFVGRLANSLANNSPFIEDLSCSPETAESMCFRNLYNFWKLTIAYRCD